MDVHFSSKTDNWATPQYFFDTLDEEFGFTLDVCADAQNAKTASFFTVEDDGLTKDWEGICWMNPPYGRTIGTWIRKAYETSLKGATVVCLVPARTDTAWWHDYCTSAAEIRFVRSRLSFGDGADRAPFPSAVVIFVSVAENRLRKMASTISDLEEAIAVLEQELEALAA